MGHQYQGRVVADTYQGKDIEGGGHVSLDDRNKGHQNLSYWDQVDRFRAFVLVQQQQPMNRGTGNNLIPNKRGAPKRKMCCPRTGTHTVASVLGAQTKNIRGPILWQVVAQLERQWCPPDRNANAGPTGMRRPRSLVELLSSNGSAGQSGGAVREQDRGREAGRWKQQQ